MIHSVKQGTGLQAEYEYAYTGSKLRVTASDGKGYAYLGSLVYMCTGSSYIFECGIFGEGTVDGSGICYHLKDHLGSIRAVIDGNGKLLEANDYYAFGQRQPRSELPQLAANRFKYNGKELQTIGNLGFLDYGARMYDVLLGRWFNVDPLCEKYYSLSPYVYCGNNPIIYIDPDGRKVRFAPGVSQQFKADFAQAVKHLNAHGAGGMLAQLEASDKIYYIAEGGSSKGSIYRPKIKTIFWNSRQGLLTDKFVALSPTTVLNHEIDHALQHDRDPQKLKEDIKNINTEYKNKEEERVITGSEQRTAKALGEIKKNEVTRKNHKGKIFIAESPISNKDINEITIKPVKSKKDENNINN